jgi:ankyrin repeat protein
MEACKRGDLQTVLRLMRGGVDVNATDGDGMTPVYTASARSHVSEVLALVTSADEDAKSVCGRTALYIACPAAYTLSARH